VSWRNPHGNRHRTRHLLNHSATESGREINNLMPSATSSASSSSAVIADIVRLISPYERAAFHDMLAYELSGRQLAGDELRRVAVNTWHAFCLHGWPEED
jgi:hypothetical protein